LKTYNIFKNTTYAIEGLLVLIKEKAFLIELFFVIVFSIILLFLDVTLTQKSIMFMSLMVILITEALNTAIENVVDLVTSEWRELAKKAKDTASGAVFLSIFQAIVVWSINLF